MNVGDTAFYLKDGKVHSAKILCKLTVENLHNDWDCTEVQKNIFNRFGKARAVYATCHGEFDAELCFSTKELLLESL